MIAIPDYKTMYFKLLRAQNRAIGALVQAAQEAETLAIEEKDPLRLPGAPVEDGGDGNTE